MRPKVSVLLPAYNVQDYIAESIRSLQRQTLRDIEIIVVNDGSTDATPAIVAQLASGDKRIHLLHMPQNVGISSALNFGLPSCDAPYIARLDGDDIALPTRLEEQLAFMSANSSVAILGTDYIVIDQHGNRLRELKMPTTEGAIAKVMEFRPPCLHGTWLVRSQTYQQLNGYRAMNPAQDYDFNLRAIDAGLRSANLPKTLNMIRIFRTGNTSDVAGLRQCKANRYIARLHRMRLRSGADDFTPEAFARATRQGRWEAKAYRLALHFLKRASASKSLIKKFPYWTLAALSSPWQLRSATQSLRCKIATWE